MNVIADRRFSGPLRGKLVATTMERVADHITQRNCLVQVKGDQGPYHDGEVVPIPAYDLFTTLRYSGICTLTYSGKPDFSEVEEVTNEEFYRRIKHHWK